MRPFFKGAVLLAVSASVFGATPPGKQLVEQYIERTQAEQVVTAEIESYAEQLGSNVDPKTKERLLQYLNAAMGWDAIKDQYAALIEKTYTAEELNALVTFLDSPLGASITEKNQLFAREMAALIATNARRVTNPPSASTSGGGDSLPDSEIKLKAINVEEHNLDGRVYFTGEVENSGKQPVEGVRVEINLFASDKFVDQYHAYVSGKVVPGVKRYFKVSCGCKDSPPAEHDSFKALIVEGF